MYLHKNYTHTHAHTHTHTHIYIYVYIYIGSISSLMQFSLNIIAKEATGTIYRITFKSKRHNFQRQRRP